MKKFKRLSKALLLTGSIFFALSMGLMTTSCSSDSDDDTPKKEAINKPSDDSDKTDKGEEEDKGEETDKGDEEDKGGETDTSDEEDKGDETDKDDDGDKDEIDDTGNDETEALTLVLTSNIYDTSHDDNAEIVGIQVKYPLKKTAADYADIQIGDEYVIHMKGKASAAFSGQVLLFDGTESAGWSTAITPYADYEEFSTEFNISKTLKVVTLPTTGSVGGKGWNLADSFQLMIDVPAGLSATESLSPITLILSEFSVTKKTGEQQHPEITDWTITNDFSSSTIASGWETANWTNGDMFYCGWKPDHITFNENNNGLMKIKLDNTTFVNGATTIPYTSGELRTSETYGYGYYAVKMKPCKYSGTNSSFFLYTRDDSNDIEWNEIDIEFLGKDTTKVQFNYYLDNMGEGHEYLCSLDFDASEDFHVYGIEYTPEYIKWYVDGKVVHTVTGCTSDHSGHAKGTLPKHDMQIMTNFWPGTGVDEWLGTFNYTKPLYAEYDYIKYKAMEIK